MMTNSLLVSFAGKAIQIQTNHAGLARSIAAHFDTSAEAQTPIIAAYKIENHGEDTFSMFYDGRGIHPFLHFEQTLFHLMQHGLEQLNGAADASLVFHAASVSLGDRGVILCGKSGSGKSTLTAHLLLNGFQYLTDEVISLPLNEFNITGFKRSLVLKKGSAFIWRMLQDSPQVLKFNNGSAWIPSALFGSASVVENVTPKILLFPTYKKDSGFWVEPISQATALFKLMQTLVNARNLPERGLTAASNLARNIRAFEMTYSDLEQAGKWIRNIL